MEEEDEVQWPAGIENLSDWLLSTQMEVLRRCEENSEALFNDCVIEMAESAQDVINVMLAAIRDRKLPERAKEIVERKQVDSIRDLMADAEIVRTTGEKIAERHDESAYSGLLSDAVEELPGFINGFVESLLSLEGKMAAIHDLMSCVLDDVGL